MILKRMRERKNGKNGKNGFHDGKTFLLRFAS